MSYVTILASSIQPHCTTALDAGQDQGDTTSHTYALCQCILSEIFAAGEGLERV
jgi:hypothetical protein